MICELKVVVFDFHFIPDVEALFGGYQGIRCDGRNGQLLVQLDT